REIAITGTGYAPEGGLLEHGAPVPNEASGALRDALRIAVLANRADVVQGEQGWKVRGDPTDAALLVAARKAGVERAGELAMWPEIGELPFDSRRMLMASYHRGVSGESMAFVKGAPRRIIDASTRIIGLGGVMALDGAGRAELLSRNAALAERGLRVIALATGAVPVVGGDFKNVPTGGADGRGMPSGGADVPRALTFVGLVGIVDPPAPGVKETIARFRDAGIRTVMLTGDQQLTAESIARALDLMRPGDLALDGAELQDMSDAELGTQVACTVVFSRMSPEAKLRVIAALQRQGEIVAMLGDGVNDAAALQQADIGVAMGLRGTDVAKQVAGIVLADDRFQTIGAAVEEGRVVFANIRKFIFYLFSCNAGELLVLVGAGAAGFPLPLLPLQILWLNLVTDTFPALALALEPAEPALMHQPPRSSRAGLLSARMLRSMLLHAALIAGVTLAAFVWGMRGSAAGDARTATTLSFMTLALAQILHLGNARSSAPVATVHRALANPYALGALVVTILLQLLAVGYAPLAHVLELRPLAASEWIIVIALGAIPAVIGQLLRRSRPPSRSAPASSAARASARHAVPCPPRCRS
ncbi:MAG TPA: HAD-IC family P-type ATPase, partial [Gemmatimonadaceae bacterium]